MRRIPLAAPRPRTPAERAERARAVRVWVRAPELPERVEEWPLEWLDRYEERAGIMEFLGELPRDEAERRAEARVREAFEREVPGPDPPLEPP